jgi:hypothetical protein
MTPLEDLWIVRDKKFLVNWARKNKLQLIGITILPWHLILLDKKTIEVDLEVLVPLSIGPHFLEHGNCLVNILLFLLMMLLARSDFRFADAQEMLSYFEKETDS